MLVEIPQSPPSAALATFLLSLDELSHQGYAIQLTDMTGCLLNYFCYVQLELVICFLHGILVNMAFSGQAR